MRCALSSDDCCHSSAANSYQPNPRLRRSASNAPKNAAKSKSGRAVTPRKVPLAEHGVNCAKLTGRNSQGRAALWPVQPREVPFVGCGDLECCDVVVRLGDDGQPGRY